LLLTKDQDHAPESLEYTIVNPPHNGQLLLNGLPTNRFTQADINAGRIVYQHNGSLTTEDYFDFDVNDGLGSSTPGRFEILITITNFSPQGNPDHYQMVAGTQLVGQISVLANDTDPNEDRLAAFFVAGPKYGTLTLQQDGTFVYRPKQGFFGTDRFSYRPHDGLQFGNISEVEIKVDAVMLPNSVANLEQTAAIKPLIRESITVEATESPVDEAVEKPESPLGQPENTAKFTAQNPARRTAQSDNKTGNHLLDRLNKDRELRAQAEALLRQQAVYSHQAKALSDENLQLISNLAEQNEEQATLQLLQTISNLSRETKLDLGSIDFQFTVAATFGTVGYLLWSLRGGLLLTATMAQSPIWRFIDPLPVLDQYVSNKSSQPSDSVDEMFSR
jgi:hypothetical protein